MSAQPAALGCVLADCRGMQVFPISARQALRVKLETSEAAQGGGNGKRSILSLCEWLELCVWAHDATALF